MTKLASGTDDCLDVNECSTGNFSCLSGLKCENTQGSYRCRSSDECRTGEHNCDEHAKCEATMKGFKCACLEGYYGTGEYCTAGQCPDSSCPENQKCISPTTLGCECKTGYAKNLADNCSDIDECSEDNDCDVNAVCSNTEGSYNCNCKTGFVGNGKSCSEGQCTEEVHCSEHEVRVFVTLKVYLLILTKLKLKFV